MPNMNTESRVTKYDPSRSWNGFTCFTGPEGSTQLIDMTGQIRRSWELPGVPSRIIDPRLVGGRRGDIILQSTNSQDHRSTIFANQTITHFTWNDEAIWTWGTDSPDGAAYQNHDWQLLDDGSWLILTASRRFVGPLGPDLVNDQGIYHVASNGELLWTWFAGDHLAELGIEGDRLAALRASSEAWPDDPWGILELNALSTIGPNVHHEANPDGPFHPDNLIIGSRKANVVAVVDRLTGNIVWRLGPDFEEDQAAHHSRILATDVPRAVDQLSGQHHPHMIGPDLPGAGNILIFDNQGGAGFPPAPLGIFPGSRVIEIDPISQDIVWQYSALSSGQPPWAFHAPFVSAAQRLPNGNTLITEGPHGRLFQVTPEGDIVWEYLHKAVDYPGPGKAVRSPLIYRAQAVPYSWVPEDVHHSEGAIKGSDDG
jgi:hypothetical protein